MIKPISLKDMRYYFKNRFFISKDELLEKLLLQNYDNDGNYLEQFGTILLTFLKLIFKIISFI